MARERTGRGIAVLALLISLIALGISILAYQEAGGERGVQEQVRVLRDTVESVRKETADALARIERAVRPTEKSQELPVRTK
jgi:hypothetical protein